MRSISTKILYTARDTTKSVCWRRSRIRSVLRVTMMVLIIIIFISIMSLRFLQNYKDSPFSEATQQSKILLVQSLIRTVTTQETFLYQPLGPMGLVTSIKTTMDLNLKKRSPIRVRKI